MIYPSCSIENLPTYWFRLSQIDGKSQQIFHNMERMGIYKLRKTFRGFPFKQWLFVNGRKSRSLKALRKVTEAQSLRSFKSAVANVVDAWYILCVCVSLYGHFDFLD